MGSIPSEVYFFFLKIRKKKKRNKPFCYDSRILFQLRRNVIEQGIGRAPLPGATFEISKLELCTVTTWLLTGAVIACVPP